VGLAPPFPTGFVLKVVGGVNPTLLIRGKKMVYFKSKTKIKSFLIESYIITILLVMLAEPVWAEKASDPSLLTLERIFSSDEFKTEKFGPVRWLEDGTGYTTLEDSKSQESGKDIVRYDPESETREVLVSADSLIPPGESRPLDINDYSWSADGNKLLIFTNTKRLWRENTRGDYWILDLTPAFSDERNPADFESKSGGKLHKLGGDAESSTLMFAKFSPDSRYVAYVCQRNLYVQYLKNYRIKELTKNGSTTIINGTSDWVYEEEFRLRDGFRWSPDSRSIAYWQFDTEKTRDFHLINYTDSLYPKISTFNWGGEYLWRQITMVQSSR